MRGTRGVSEGESRGEGTRQQSCCRRKSLVCLSRKSLGCVAVIPCLSSPLLPSFQAINGSGSMNTRAYVRAPVYASVCVGSCCCCCCRCCSESNSLPRIKEGDRRRTRLAAISMSVYALKANPRSALSRSLLRERRQRRCRHKRRK